MNELSDSCVKQFSLTDRTSQKKEKNHSERTEKRKEKSRLAFQKLDPNRYPEDWKFVSLERLNSQCKEVINPADYPEEIFEYYSYPAYQSSGEPAIEKGSKILSQKILLKDDVVLFGRLNPRVEKVWKVCSDSQYRKICSTEWIPIFPNSEVDADFLFYIEWSRDVMALAKRLATGSTPSRQRVDTKSFYKIGIPLPPLPEQQRIASILMSVDDTIQKTQLIIELTQRLKTGLMQQLFTKGIGHDEFENTEIGSIPKEWKVIRLSEVFQLASGKSRPPSFSHSPEEGVSRSIYGGNGVLGYTDKYLTDKDTIVIGRVGEYCGSIHKAPKLSWITDNAMYIVRLKCKIDLDFLEYLLAHLNLNRLRRKTSQPLLTQKIVYSVKIPLLTYFEQRKIATILSSVDEKIQKEEQYKSQLQTLKKGLMQDLLTGKVRVKVEN